MSAALKFNYGNQGTISLGFLYPSSKINIGKPKLKEEQLKINIEKPKLSNKQLEKKSYNALVSLSFTKKLIIEAKKRLSRLAVEIEFEKLILVANKNHTENILIKFDSCNRNKSIHDKLKIINDKIELSNSLFEYIKKIDLIQARLTKIVRYIEIYDLIISKIAKVEHLLIFDKKINFEKLELLVESAIDEDIVNRLVQEYIEKFSKY